ncbi:hypothetical protein A3K79_06925 [Candidatus Bathyarchaeota archaeon RBG_13_46_16b]|nr:MAG: hypothetical protein A3K79_06925 [Candidatus Bathyarchaeota archaeon RBG_13_46_16b]
MKRTSQVRENARYTSSIAFIRKKATRLLIRILGGGDSMPKCGLCGAEVKEQPKITAEGKCSVCGAKLVTIKTFRRAESKR